MNQVLKRVLLSVLFFTILILGIIGLYRIFSWKNTAGEYFSCLEEAKTLPDNTVDVVFIGASKVYGSANPAIIWDEGGIASFTLSISGMAQPSAYYHLKDFIKNQSPKIVFAEASLLYTEGYLDMGNVYRNTIVMEPSVNNLKLIKETNTDVNKLDLLLRFPIIHGRYKELQREDFGVKSPEDVYCLGYVNGYTIEPQEASTEVYYLEEKTEPSDETVQWMDKMISLSEQENFELIFYMVPHTILPPYQRIFNGAREYLSHKGIRVIDLNTLNGEIGIDYSQDFADGNHLNTYGAEKVSKWLSDYIATNFDIPDHRGASEYERWDMCSSYYEESLIDMEVSKCSSVAEIQDMVSQNNNLLLVISDDKETVVTLSDNTIYDSRNAENTFVYELNERDNLCIKKESDAIEGSTVICIGKQWYRNPGETGPMCLVYDMITEKVVVVCRE